MKAKKQCPPMPKEGTEAWHKLYSDSRLSLVLELVVAWRISVGDGIQLVQPITVPFQSHGEDRPYALYDGDNHPSHIVPAEPGLHLFKALMNTREHQILGIERDADVDNDWESIFPKYTKQAMPYVWRDDWRYDNQEEAA